MTPLEYEYLRGMLRDHSGLDLSGDKQYLIESRLLPLLRKAGLLGIGELVQKLKGGSASLTTQVVEAMTTNETFFFRDKIPFDHMRETILPALTKARANRRKPGRHASQACRRRECWCESPGQARPPCSRYGRWTTADVSRRGRRAAQQHRHTVSHPLPR